MQRILAVSNQKGGVGKTTTAINLSSALARMGQSVVLIDLDPQGNASSGLGRPKSKSDEGIADVLLDRRPLSETLVQVDGESNLMLCPSTTELIGLPLEMAELENRESRLKDIIQYSDIDADYIIIDCPPALNLLTLNALVAADGVLAPVQAEYFALEGMSDLLSTIQHVRKALNPHLGLAGVIMTMVNMNIRLTREIVEQTRAYFGVGVVFEAMATRNVPLSEAPSHGMSIHQYSPNSVGSKAYSAIASELLFRDGKIESPNIASGPATGWKSQIQENAVQYGFRRERA